MASNGQNLRLWYWKFKIHDSCPFEEEWQEKEKSERVVEGNDLVIVICAKSIGTP